VCIRRTEGEVRPSAGEFRLCRVSAQMARMTLENFF
jgi:hypothetical protein